MKPKTIFKIIILLVFIASAVFVSNIDRRCYYNDLNILLQDLSQNTTNNTCSKKEAKFELISNEIKLLDNITLENDFNFEGIILNLNGHDLTINKSKLRFTDCTLKSNNSKINIEVSGAENIIILINSDIENIDFNVTGESDLIKIIEAQYDCNISNCNITTDMDISNKQYTIYSYENLNIDNVSITSTLNSNSIDKRIYCVGIKSTNLSTTISNSKIYIENFAQYGVSYGISTNKESNLLDISDTSIYVDSHYLHLENGYGSTSIGILSNSEKTYINNCDIRGVHSGAQLSGFGEVNNSTLKGLGHGGIYFSKNKQSDELPTIFLIKNSTLSWEEPKGVSLQDTSNPAYSGTNNAGFYIGGTSGASNIQVYMDSCEVIGNKHSAVLRGSSGEHDNGLYVSNTTFNYPIRVDNENLILQIGKGNNITPSDLVCYKWELIHYSEISNELIVFNDKIFDNIDFNIN